MSKINFPSKDPIVKLKKTMNGYGYNKKTIISYLYYITELLDFAKKTPRNINTDDIIKYINRLKEDGKSNSTINTAVSAFKFYFEKKLNRSFFSPKGKIKRVKHHIKRPTTITDREFKRIIKHANKKYKILFGLLYLTGIKISEIVKIKINNIDFKDKSIKITNNTNSNRKKDNYTKTRVVKIPKAVYGDLKEYTENNNKNYLFLNNSNNRVTDRSIQKMFNTLKNKANIKKPITCNSLRSSFVANLIKNSTELGEIQEIMGYKLPETIKRQEKFIKSNRKSVRRSIKDMFHIK